MPASRIEEPEASDSLKHNTGVDGESTQLKSLTRNIMFFFHIFDQSLSLSSDFTYWSILRFAPHCHFKLQVRLTASSEFVIVQRFKIHLI